MGYALRKAKRKFPNNGNDIAKLCREEATFEFGQNVERIKDRLHFPVRDLYDVFRQIYCIYKGQINVSTITKVSSALLRTANPG